MTDPSSLRSIMQRIDASAPAIHNTANAMMKSITIDQCRHRFGMAQLSLDRS
jgi:hypothetical protein